MTRVEPALAQRLETLTGEKASCCVADYATEVASVQAAPAFQAALQRHKALADERRLTALAILKARGSLCACEIQAALKLTHGTVSHHMAQLQAAELVTAEKRGKWVHYALTPEGRRLAGGLSR